MIKQDLTYKGSFKDLNDGILIALLGGAFLMIQSLSQVLNISLIQSLSLIAAGISIIFFLFIATQFIRVKRSTKLSGPSLSLGEWTNRRYFELDRRFQLAINSFTHILITGVTRSGKSTLIRRFLTEISRLKMGFLYIDFKGEERELQEIYDSLKKNNFNSKVQIFDLSIPDQCLTCNLLTVFPDVAETVGFALEIFELDHPFYRSEAEQYLRYSILLLDATQQPRTFEGLLNIYRDDLYRSRLLHEAKTTHRGAPFELYFQQVFGKLQERDRAERFSGLMAKLSSLTEEPLKKVFNSQHSQFELSKLFDDARPTIIRIPGEAYGDLSKRIVKAFIKALPILLSRRRKDLNVQDYFIFLDEQCSYTSDTIVDVLKKAGSARVHCILTRQCDGDFEAEGPGFLSKILSACSLSFTFLVLDPLTRDTLSKQMGTKLSHKQTWRISGGQQTGEASEREVHQFQIPPDTFAELKPGECIVSARLSNLNLNRKLKVYSAS